jgi:diguanylate cyclase (GGDEF)-like protein
LKNQNYRTLKPWKDYGLFDITNKVIETGETISNEFFYVSTSGKEIWLNGICAPFHSGDDLNLLFMFEDITARKVAEANLKKVSSQMELWVSQLEKRNDTSTALREMGAMLQVCSNQTEAMAVIKQFGSRLFPTSSGGVFLAGFPSTIVETFEYWGETLSSEVVFSIEDCWSLRRSLIHTVHGVSEGLRCQHMPEGFRGTYIDVPLLSSSDLLGLLHIEWPEIHKIDQETRELIETVAEHLSLSISNIRLRESLRAQSIRDPLTGVFNRRFMEESLERELPRARRKKSHVGIMLMDLDHFKMFNDLYGHEAGDLVLKEISNVLRTAIRKEDIVCRFGGEEFVVILPEADLDITNKRAELIRKEVSEIRLTYEEKQLNAITMSIGVAVYPDHGESSNIVLKAADAALYRAKEEGRNRVVVANQGF